MRRLDQYIIRDRSVLTGERSLAPLYQFKDFPVFFGCTDDPQETDLVADMVWDIEPQTGLIQLSKLIPLEILYQKQHVDGCGPTWQKYYQEFANYILKTPAKHYHEIGGGMGELARTVTRQSSSQWTMIEPNPTQPTTDRIHVIRSFFNDRCLPAGSAEALVFSQVLEHAYDPNQFIADANQALMPGGKLIFAYPNLEVWLKKKYTNAINFEHCMFLTDVFVEYLLAKNGFKILDKTTYEEHSHFYVTEKSKTPISAPPAPNHYGDYKKIFDDFIDYHVTIIRDLNTKIASARGPVYLFGAHIFSQFLLNFGLKSDSIVSILDNSPTKEGKRLYGTRFKVEKPHVLKNQKNVNVILKAGIYEAEIKKDILENINPNVVFW